MSRAKQLGQFFTPEPVAKALVRWALRDPADRVLDPSCGDGEFLSAHEHAVGIELDRAHAATARGRAPAALVHEADFFAWAEETHERFEAIVGNPPFIRYQGFAGTRRSQALQQAARFGAALPELTSSWAPFIAAAALLLKPAGRIAFVVPAEIGHASYAIPLLESLCRRFERVLVVAIREKLFPGLSEDAWLLYADGYGGTTDRVDLAIRESFAPSARPPLPDRVVSLRDLRSARSRLRRWLLPKNLLDTYCGFEDLHNVSRLGAMADVGIGYVSGANGFLSLAPLGGGAARHPHAVSASCRPARRIAAVRAAVDEGARRLVDRCGRTRSPAAHRPRRALLARIGSHLSEDGCGRRGSFGL